jgi:hypothetical protein
MKPYSILITGIGISGKSSLAKMLEEDLCGCDVNVVNKDVDWDRGALDVPDSQAYILQTPKGCDAERIHEISFGNFDKILYCDPGVTTYLSLLANRGCAWVREGILEKGDEDVDPYSIRKTLIILRKISEYAASRSKLRQGDIRCFNNFVPGGRVRRLEPFFDSGNLLFKNYDVVLEDIVESLHG